MAITQSPMYLSTVPLWRKTTSVMSVRYSFSISATTSGSIFSDSEVKPRRSEKNTVISWRAEPRFTPSPWRTISRRTSGEKNCESRRFSRCSRMKCSIDVAT